jgi:SPOR domain
LEVAVGGRGSNVSRLVVSDERLNGSNLMAENNQRSYRERRGAAEERPGTQGDDPLAELARMIGQSVPMNKTSGDRRRAPATDRRELDRAASHATPDEVLHDPSDEADAAMPQDARYERDLGSDFRAGHAERYEPAARANPAPSVRASRFRQEPDFAIEQARDAHGTAYQEAADWHDPSLDAQQNRHSEEHADEYEYENEAYDADHDGYDEEYGEDLRTGRRSGFVFVAAVFTLAVLGAAGAFAYRTMFGAPALPALPPIIKAEGGPNKIIPSDANSQTDATRDADSANAGSGERLVSREERPVDIPPPATNSAPRPVATVPVFPDPPAMGGPGGVVGYAANPNSGSPAVSTEPPAPPAPAMTTATAPNPSGNQVFPPAAATPAMPTASGPKKIRTVTIHTDQSADAATSPGVPARAGTQPPQGGNAPLSIVPSSTDAPAPAAAAAPLRPRPTTPQSVPLNKPAANQTVSAAPAVPVAPAAQAAPVATGGYAVQVSSQRSEAEAQSSYRDLQAKYPDVLGGREPTIRRADLGAKGIYFRAMVGPFTSADQATELCSNLKAAGGSCIVQKN